jgi:hypothetical protein
MAECFKAPFTTTCRSTSRRFAIPTRMDARRDTEYGGRSRFLTSILVKVYARFPTAPMNAGEVENVQTIAQWLVPLRL